MVAQVSPWLHRSAHGCTGQPMVAQVSPWLHRSAHGCTGQPMVAQVSPWLHRSAHGCTGQPMVPQVSPWLHRSAHGCTGQPMVAQASPWLDSEQEHLMDKNILNSITPVPTKAYNGPSHEFLLMVVLGSCTWPWWQESCELFHAHVSHIPKCIYNYIHTQFSPVNSALPCNSPLRRYLPRRFTHCSSCTYGHAKPQSCCK